MKNNDSQHGNKVNLVRSSRSPFLWCFWPLRFIRPENTCFMLKLTSLCVNSSNVVVFAFWSLIVCNGGCVTGPLMLEREYVCIWADRCFIKLFWLQLQLVQRLSLSLQRLIDGVHLRLVLGVLVSGPLLQQKSSALALLEREFRSVTDPGAHIRFNSVQMA